MSFPPMPTKSLADLLGRMSTALSAGIAVRRAWKGEVERAPRRHRPALEEVGRRLDAGDGFAVALRSAGDTFPPLVLSMAEVGERTGHEAEVLRDLARSLDHAVRTRRALVAALVKPALQLVAAILVVGFLIWIAGSIRDMNQRPVDILGTGLVGTRGLVAYAGLVAAALAAVFLVGRATFASWRRRGIARPLVDRVPILGAATRAAEAAAWCRAAAMAGAAGLDVGRLVRLASSVAPGLALDADGVEAGLRGGASFADTLRAARVFPATLVEGVAVGELTGTTPEKLDRLAAQFDEDARRGFEASAGVAGGIVWAIVAGLIVVVIFRIFSFYVGTIQSALG